MSEEIIRQRITFIGDVQGVGLRYRARYAAESLGLTGWVENRFDDTVLMEVQGPMELINKMLVIINQGAYVHVKDLIRKNIPTQEHETGFHVKYPI